MLVDYSSYKLKFKHSNRFKNSLDFSMCIIYQVHVFLNVSVNKIYFYKIFLLTCLDKCIPEIIKVNLRI